MTGTPTLTSTADATEVPSIAMVPATPTTESTPATTPDLPRSGVWGEPGATWGDENP